MPLEKPCIFVGSSKADLSVLPQDVKTAVGKALYRAQLGKEDTNVKALKGFGGWNVLEVIEDHDGDTYRAVYTIRFSTGVYVLHVFQKKSKSGIATPRHVMKLIESRLKDAELLHRHHHKGGP
jgi:phage-related protein